MELADLHIQDYLVEICIGIVTLIVFVVILLKATCDSSKKQSPRSGTSSRQTTPALGTENTRVNGNSTKADDNSDKSPEIRATDVNPIPPATTSTDEELCGESASVFVVKGYNTHDKPSSVVKQYTVYPDHKSPGSDKSVDNPGSARPGEISIPDIPQSSETLDRQPLPENHIKMDTKGGDLVVVTERTPNSEQSHSADIATADDRELVFPAKNNTVSDLCVDNLSSGECEVGQVIAGGSESDFLPGEEGAGRDGVAMGASGSSPHTAEVVVDASGDDEQEGTTQSQGNQESTESNQDSPAESGGEEETHGSVDDNCNKLVTTVAKTSCDVGDLIGIGLSKTHSEENGDFIPDKETTGERHVPSLDISGPRGEVLQVRHHSAQQPILAAEVAAVGDKGESDGGGESRVSEEHSLADAQLDRLISENLAHTSEADSTLVICSVNREQVKAARKEELDISTVGDGELERFIDSLDDLVVENSGDSPRSDDSALTDSSAATTVIDCFASATTAAAAKSGTNAGELPEEGTKSGTIQGENREEVTNSEAIQGKNLEKGSSPALVLSSQAGAGQEYTQADDRVISRGSFAPNVDISANAGDCERQAADGGNSRAPAAAAAEEAEQSSSAASAAGINHQSGNNAELSFSVKAENEQIVRVEHNNNKESSLACVTASEENTRLQQEAKVKTQVSAVVKGLSVSNPDLTDLDDMDSERYTISRQIRLNKSTPSIVDHEEEEFLQDTGYSTANNSPEGKRRMGSSSGADSTVVTRKLVTLRRSNSSKDSPDAKRVSDSPLRRTRSTASRGQEMTSSRANFRRQRFIRRDVSPNQEGGARNEVDRKSSPPNFASVVEEGRERSGSLVKEQVRRFSQHSLEGEGKLEQGQRTLSREIKTVKTEAIVIKDVKPTITTSQLVTLDNINTSENKKVELQATVTSPTVNFVTTKTGAPVLTRQPSTTTKSEQHPLTTTTPEAPTPVTLRRKNSSGKADAARASRDSSKRDSTALQEQIDDYNKYVRACMEDLTTRLEEEKESREKAEQWCDFLESELDAHINARIVAEERHARLKSSTKTVVSKYKAMHDRCKLMERKLADLGINPSDLVTEVTVLNREEEMGKEYHFLQQVEKQDTRQQAPEDRRVFQSVSTVQAYWQEQYNSRPREQSTHSTQSLLRDIEKRVRNPTDLFLEHMATFNQITDPEMVKTAATADTRNSQKPAAVEAIQLNTASPAISISKTSTPVVSSVSSTSTTAVRLTSNASSLTTTMPKTISSAVKPASPPASEKVVKLATPDVSPDVKDPADVTMDTSPVTKETRVAKLSGHVSRTQSCNLHDARRPNVRTRRRGMSPAREVDDQHQCVKVSAALQMWEQKFSPSPKKSRESPRGSPPPPLTGNSSPGSASPPPAPPRDESAVSRKLQEWEETLQATPPGGHAHRVESGPISGADAPEITQKKLLWEDIAVGKAQPIKEVNTRRGGDRERTEEEILLQELMDLGNTEVVAESISNTQQTKNKWESLFAGGSQGSAQAQGGGDDNFERSANFGDLKSKWHNIDSSAGDSTC